MEPRDCCRLLLIGSVISAEKLLMEKNVVRGLIKCPGDEVSGMKYRGMK